MGIRDKLPFSFRTSLCPAGLPELPGQPLLVFSRLSGTKGINALFEYQLGLKGILGQRPAMALLEFEAQPTSEIFRRADGSLIEGVTNAEGETALKLAEYGETVKIQIL